MRSTWSLVLLLLLLWPEVAFPAEGRSFAEQVKAIVRGQKSADVSDSELEAARARSLSGRWSFLPSVTASATRARSTLGGENTSVTDSKEASIEASVNVFKFGADAASREAGAESVRAAELGAKSKALASETAAVGSLSEAIASRREMGVYQRRMSAARQSVAAADARFKKGILSEQEFAKLKLEASSLEMSYRAAQRKADKMTAFLKSWGSDVGETAGWPLADDPVIFKKAKEWIAASTAGDLRLRVLQAQSAVAESAVTMSRGRMLPSLDMSAGWSKSGEVSESAGLADRKQVMMTLTVPLFSKFSDYGEYRARAHEAAAANASLEAERLISAARFQSVVRDALAVLDDAKERQEQIAIADRLYQDNLKRFERGLISVNELSLDEHRVRAAELAAIDAWAGAHVSLFKVAEEAGVSVLGRGILD